VALSCRKKPVRREDLLLCSLNTPGDAVWWSEATSCDLLKIAF
jgi:hypothetical protein